MPRVGELGLPVESLAAMLAGLASAGGRSVGRGDGAACVASTASICLGDRTSHIIQTVFDLGQRDLSDSLSVVTPAHRSCELAAASASNWCASVGLSANMIFPAIRVPLSRPMLYESVAEAP